MRNQTFTFIHAADLHLGAVFKGLSQIKELEHSAHLLPGGADWLQKNLFNATYQALDRLVELCLQTRPHALLLAGDLYNPEANGLKSLTVLRQAFLTLQQAGIVVCIVHGNHDPQNSLPHSWTWPENVHVFGAEKAEAVGIFFQPSVGCSLQPIEASSEAPLAVIYGMSHSSGAVTDNLAKKISLETHKHSNLGSKVYQVGLLHCAVGTASSEPGKQGEHKPYAPCSVEDLTAANLDYWALGHIHKQGQVVARPLAMYAGNTQGLHINEQGAKGCLKVALQPGLDPELIFCPLGGVQWRELDFELTPQSTASSLGDELYASLIQNVLDIPEQELSPQLSPQLCQQINAQLKSSPELPSQFLPSGYVVRLRVSGRTALNRYLHDNAEALLESLRERLIQDSSFWPSNPADNALDSRKYPFIWLKDIRLNTQPLQNLEQARNRDDLLGESLRRIEAAKFDQDLHKDLLKDVKSALGQLFACSNARQAGLVAPNAEEWTELLDQAAALCADLLGPEEDTAATLQTHKAQGLNTEQAAVQVIDPTAEQAMNLPADQTTGQLANQAPTQPLKQANEKMGEDEAVKSAASPFRREQGNR